MNYLNDFLKEGLNYELTHQIAIKILLENNSFFVKEISGQKFNDLEVIIEPRCKGKMYSKKKERFINSSIRFDIGLKEKGVKKYTTLIELKMWSTTGKNQVRNQIKVTKDEGIQLVYIIIGYPDQVLSGIVKKAKEENELVDFLYFDLESFLKKLENFTDDKLIELYANFLNKELLYARKKTTISNTKAHVFSCQNYIVKKLDELKIQRTFFCSNENGGGTSLRCYAEGNNDGKKYLEKFNIYLLFKNDSIIIEIYTNPEIKTTELELQQFIESVLFVLPEEIVSKKVYPRKEVTEYKKIFEKKLDFSSTHSLNQSVSHFYELFKVLQVFDI